MSKGTDNLALGLLTEEATVVPVGLETVNYIQLPPSLCLGARGAKPVLVAPGPMGAFSAPIAPGQRCGWGSLVNWLCPCF
ncbi:hypothetical protein N658DRAFT_146379 [Parathielavia hyrcaniae]|uniref:Uncharacterized protein n=1 Tax=Parathielavia hyrcaniae TaxID=113614 RepID=A0AAN6T0B4_9PEZI|nr:hypothetical protein N658DRAFT_146379 [Parathielavia hyrcaniae]